MKEINFQDIYGWKMSNIFDEIYHKSVNIVGVLDDTIMVKEHREELDIDNNYENDEPYTMMKDMKNPDNNPKFFICSSLRVLLQNNGYKNYNGPIRVYGIFGIKPTTKTHIAKIWKADILDEELNIIKTVEDKSMKN